MRTQLWDKELNLQCHPVQREGYKSANCFRHYEYVDTHHLLHELAAYVHVSKMCRRCLEIHNAYLPMPRSIRLR